MAMKTGAALALAALLATAAVQAQPYGYGMGPGMMGGGPGGWGMGPGMMNDWAPGGWGMGPGMMGGWDDDAWLDRPDLGLSAEQRAKIIEIQKETSTRRWDIMRRMHDQHWQWRRGATGAFDEAAARAAYAAMSEAQRQMFEASLDARKRIDAVLTPQQREQLAAPRGRR